MTARRKKSSTRRKSTTRKRSTGKAAPRKTAGKKPVGRKTRKRATRTTKPTEVALNSGYQLKDEDVERLLVTGEYEGLLEEYFGEPSYRELRDLAQQAARRTVRGGPRVLIVPGIMGSKLGLDRKVLFDDVIWIDPIDVARGKLVKLALGTGKSDIKALGVILLTYLKLKLRLEIAGFDADFHPFDWRKGIDASGAELMQRIHEDPASKVSVVAHSMGGLVTRAALSLDTNRKIEHLVMLGTGSYPLLKKVAALDLANTAEQLAKKVFTTLPGLHQMLPSPKRWSALDLYQADTWPTDAPVPRQKVLDGCLPVQDGLAEADDRFHLIAGVNQDTTTNMAIEDGKVSYTVTPNGDGTVPLDFAELPGARTYYVEEKHGSLPNNRAVGQAVIDLLRDGETSRLSTRWERAGARRRRVVPEAELRAMEPFDRRSGTELGPRERRSILEEVAAPDARDVEARAPFPGGEAPPPGPGFQHSFRNVEVTRRRARSVDLCLAQGSITEARTRALAIGLFQAVEPSGAAGAIDNRLEGAVKEFITRRMFDGAVGQVVALPTGRHLIYAESVLFAGLGDFGVFGPEVQQFVAENVVRACVRTHVEDFATVLVGAGSGASLESTVYNQLAGYFRGLKDADDENVIRRIMLVEYDPERFLQMKEEVYRLASTSLFEDISVTFDEIQLPEPSYEPPHRRGRLTSTEQLAYLIVSQEESRKDKMLLRSSILTAGSKAAILTGTREVSRTALDKLLRTIEGLTFGRLAKFGNDIAKLVLDPGVAMALREMGRDGYHIVVVHDAQASRIPWETLCIDGWFPAEKDGLSRRYAAENLAVAKWLEQRRRDEFLEVLLVVNPTEDLPGAEKEAARIKKAFPQEQSRVRLTEIRNAQATRERLLAEFSSGNYDVIHYAGHAFFEPEHRSRSGILCAGEQVLSGAQLAGIAHLPALLFFNACESARVRGRRKPGDISLREQIDRNVGLAEAFMRGGAANYVGTYWPVGDMAASEFAEVFYTQLLEGRPIGEAVQAGRKKVHGKSDVDWADYVHYGAYDFALKLPRE